jgi:hypothetical protein
MVVDLVADELDRVHELIAGRFARAEPRARVREYMSGLVTGLEQISCWCAPMCPNVPRRGLLLTLECQLQLARSSRHPGPPGD